MFSTRMEFPDDTEWGPLEAVARLARASRELPSFHEGEFMYMACATNKRKRLRIHLYKHIDTRLYLNLDDGGHGYRYCGPVPNCSDLWSAGRYRLHASIEDAIEGAQIWLFSEEPRFFRSFPPERWPTLA